MKILYECYLSEGVTTLERRVYKLETIFPLFNISIFVTDNRICTTKNPFITKIVNKKWQLKIFKNINYNII